MNSTARWFIPISLLLIIGLGLYFYYISPSRSRINADNFTVIKRRISSHQTLPDTVNQKTKNLKKDISDVKNVIENPIVDEINTDLSQF